MIFKPSLKSPCILESQTFIQKALYIVRWNLPCTSLLVQKTNFKGTLLSRQTLLILTILNWKNRRKFPSFALILKGIKYFSVLLS